jgi:hypothetical protein
MFAVLTVPPQTLVIKPITEALKRGESSTAMPPPSPFYTDDATPTLTVIVAAMSSFLSAQGNL